ncbi:ABC transporter permease [Saccharopolyspora shandongensis]|uniref:ABC transporter permease n=1 Tax=Saccharopolyspora shandongensis TaxID=418495 RepID=UPI00343F0133
MNIVEWFVDPAHWSGPDGIPRLMLDHIGYTAMAATAALIIAMPLGLFIGHTGKGTFAIAGLANSLRALPTLGLLILAVVVIAPYLGEDLAFVVPSLIVLVVLAIPPIMVNTYAGIRGIDPAVRDAAYGIGMRPFQVLVQVEIPCALPLIISGVRSATLQIISTATVAAYVSLGGLGRYIIDGQAQLDYTMMVAGALLVALLAIAVEGALLVVERLVVSRGLTRRWRTSATTRSAARRGNATEPRALVHS